MYPRNLELEERPVASTTNHTDRTVPGLAKAREATLSETLF